MRVYRLTLPRYADTPFSGEGARRVGGRWTPVGWPVVHTSGNVSLAVLETLAHTAANSMPSHRLIAVDAPESLPVEAIDAAGLPDDWRRTPPPASLQDIGRAWLGAARTAVLKAPSVIVPIEFNYLLNPRHPDFERLRAHAPEPFRIDKRLFGPAP